MTSKKLKQPNSNDCFVCGRKNPIGLYLQFYDNGENEVTSHYTVASRYQGYPGIVHGGVLASMLDEVVARVSMIGDPHHFMMSVRLEVLYRKPVPIETPLTIKGTSIRLRGRLGKAGQHTTDRSRAVGVAALGQAGRSVWRNILARPNGASLGPGKHHPPPRKTAETEKRFLTPFLNSRRMPGTWVWRCPRNREQQRDESLAFPITPKDCGSLFELFRKLYLPDLARM